MSIAPIRAECVSCLQGYRFKRNKSGRTIRNLLRGESVAVFSSQLANGKIGCICAQCFPAMSNQEKEAYTAEHGEFTVGTNQKV